MHREKGTAEDSAAGVTVPWWVVHVSPLLGYRLHVRFADGTEGEVDASGMIFGARPGVFERLRDEALFNAVYIDHGTVTGQESSTSPRMRCMTRSARAGAGS